MQVSKILIALAIAAFSATSAMAADAAPAAATPAAAAAPATAATPAKSVKKKVHKAKAKKPVAALTAKVPAAE